MKTFRTRIVKTYLIYNNKITEILERFPMTKNRYNMDSGNENRGGKYQKATGTKMKNLLIKSKVFK